MNMQRCLYCEDSFRLENPNNPEIFICESCNDFMMEVSKWDLSILKKSLIERIKEHEALIAEITSKSTIRCRIGNTLNKTEKIIDLPFKVEPDFAGNFGNIIVIPLPIEDDSIDISNAANFVYLAESYRYHVAYRVS